MKIFKKLKFRKSENRMKYVGDVKNAKKDFESKKNNNLTFLIKNRFKWMNKYIKKKDFGIEVGAGVGFSKYYIKNKNLLITDILNNDHLDLKKIDAQNSKLPQKKYNFVIASNVIHHLSNPIIFFIEMHRILKKNGKVIIFEQNCSVLFQLITYITKHEGYNFCIDVWNKKNHLFPKNEPWSGNIAIANLLFDKQDLFHKNLGHMFKIEYHKYCECFIFLNSGGVYSKTFYIPLNNFSLKILMYIDNFLSFFLPSLFSLSRKLVIKKI
jgi:SAM-dependent methyltransferase